MIKKSTQERLFLKFPETLSEEEIAELVEKARYEAFVTDGRVGRTTLFDSLVTVTMLALAIGGAALVLLSGFISSDNVLLKAGVTVCFAAIAIYLTTLIKAYNRSRFLNRKIEELLGSAPD